MRKIFASLLIISVLYAVGCRKEIEPGQRESESEGTITMSGAWALYPMAVKWAEEFQKLHPRVRIDVAAGGAGKGMADALAQVVEIGNVSRDIYPEELAKGAWWISVTKDAVVPTINENNPVLNRLLSKGITRETCISIWITGTIENWGEVIDQEITDAIHVYTRSDACGAANTWAKLLGGNQEDLLFTNLISNAIKFNREGGRVEVRLYNDGENLTAEVADTGIGIPAENLPFIFDEFYRVRNKETRNITGSGLGLSLAKKIVDAHSGSIQAISESGKGSTFMVVLPRISQGEEV